MRTRRFLFSALFMALLVAPFMSPGLGSTGDLKILIVASPAWEGYTHEDGSGLYFELLRKIYQPHGIAVETLIVPWKRAKAKILNDQAECMPAAYLTPEDDRWTYPGYPMDVDYTAVVFLRRKVEAWDGLKTLAGKSVVWPRGYNFQNYLDVNVDWTEIDSRQQGWEMVAKGRADFYMDIQPEIESALEKKDIDLKKFGYETVFSIKTYLRFGNAPKAEKLRHIYNEGIEEMLKTGKLKRLFDKWGANFPGFAFTKR